MAVVFIAQNTLLQWADQGKVRLDGTTLHLVKEAREVSLRPAVRFTEVLGSDVDPNGLVGKVKTAEQLAELGAEHYMDSVLLGEVAYTVVEGFLGDLTPPTSGAATRAPASAPTQSVVSVEGASSATVSSATVSSATVSTEKPSEEPSSADEAALLSQLFLDTVRS